MNILFICSKNQWRSLTAETIFKGLPNHFVKSAGTAHDARVRVNEKLIAWADLIFVMEKKHRSLLDERFSESMTEKELVVLDIPDDYHYMDPELIEMLKAAVKPWTS